MPKTAVPFTVEDLRTPERLERVLGLFNKALEQGHAAATAPLDLGSLASQLAPMLRDQLQSPGAFPLNLTALLPAIAGAVVTEGTHSDRLTLLTPPSAVGAIFWETDRTVAYVAVNAGGPLVWRFMAGEYIAGIASRPADLGPNDSGFLFYAFDQSSVYIWTGVDWDTITRRILFNAGFFSIFNAVLTATRTYQLPDADGNITYETAPLANDNILTGGGGALVKDSGNTLTINGYVPTLFSVANITSSIPQTCFFLRFGPLVIVFGRYLVTSTLVGAQSQLGMSLPVPSNFTATTDCAGTAANPGVAGDSHAAVADTINDRAEWEWIAVTPGTADMRFIMGYVIH